MQYIVGMGVMGDYLNADLQPGEIWAWPPVLREESAVVCNLSEDPTSRFYYLPDDIRYRSLLLYLCVYSHGLLSTRGILAVGAPLFSDEGTLVLTGTESNHSDDRIFWQAYSTTPVRESDRTSAGPTSADYYPFARDDPRTYAGLVDRRPTGYVLPAVRLTDLPMEPLKTRPAHKIHEKRGSRIALCPYMTNVTVWGSTEMDLPFLQARAYPVNPQSFITRWAAQPTLAVVERVTLAHDNLTHGGLLLHVIYAKTERLTYFRSNTRTLKRGLFDDFSRVPPPSPAQLSALSPAVMDYTPTAVDPAPHHCAFILVRLTYDIDRRSYRLHEEHRMDYDTPDISSPFVVYENKGQFRLVQRQLVGDHVWLRWYRWDESGPFSMSLPGWNNDTSFEFDKAGVLYGRNEEEVRWWN